MRKSLFFVLLEKNLLQNADTCGRKEMSFHLCHIVKIIIIILKETCSENGALTNIQIIMNVPLVFK